MCFQCKFIAGLLQGLIAALIWCGWPADGQAATWYVATNGAGDGTSWENATNSIMIAYTAAVSNDTVLVSNGVYNTGGIRVTGSPTNRVVIKSYVTVRSLLGPEETIIEGAWSSDGNTNGTDAARCVYMYASSRLIGFTLSGGATHAESGEYGSGGGVYCGDLTVRSPMISNCVFAGNNAYSLGGAAQGVTMYNCVLTNNTANLAGGAMQCNLYNCTVVNNFSRGGQGGVRSCLVSNSVLRGNYTLASMGGAGYATLYNCLILQNWASNQTGGAGQSSLYNCTIVSNYAGSSGGGIKDGVETVNCISWGNNLVDNNPKPAFSCGEGIIYDSGSNFTNDPQFVDFNAGDFRLLRGSPCINSGSNQPWMDDALDLEGNPRVMFGTVDRGAYEYFVNAGTVISLY